VEGFDIFQADLNSTKTIERGMLDSKYRPLALIFTEFKDSEITVYAI
jgi:hypothetical protein